MSTIFKTIENCPPKNKTIFTHVQDSLNGWSKSYHQTKDFDKVIYLGKCTMDGDMFACYKNKTISIYKGTKGDEFND